MRLIRFRAVLSCRSLEFGGLPGGRGPTCSLVSYPFVRSHFGHGGQRGAELGSTFTLTGQA